MMIEPLQSVPNLSRRVYQAILNEICDGTLAPGTHLVQEQLASQLGVSRHPIQQAMALLRADGMIEDVGKRGQRVTRLDVGLMRDHYDIRAALDGLAAKRAASRLAEAKNSEDLKARGESILEAGNKAVSAEDIADMIHHDEAFHGLIYEASGNALLPGTAEVHWRFLRRVMGDVLRQAEPPREIWKQHENIFEAVLRGDADLAERLAIDHVEHAAATLSAALDAEAEG